MTLTENEYELLETYLDNGLTDDQEADLRKRLTANANLAAALAEIQTARKLRQQVWQSMEPAKPAVDKVLRRFKATQLQVRHQRWSRFSQYGMAAAACVLIGFGVGWMGRGTSPINSNIGTAVTPVSMHLNQVNQAPESPLIYQVVLRDANGRPLKIWRFQTLEEAQQFLQQMNRGQ